MFNVEIFRNFGTGMQKNISSFQIRFYMKRIQILRLLSLSLVLEAITFIPRGFNLHFRKNYSSHYNHHRTSYICVPTRPLNHTSSNPWTIVQGMLEKTVRTREKLRMQLNIRNAILKHFLDLRNLLKTKTRESWNLENIEGLEVFYDLSRSRWAKTMPVSFS